MKFYDLVIRIRRNAGVKNLAFYLILIAGTGLAAWMSVHYPAEFDWSFNAHNTLSKASQDLLNELKGPVRIVAYTSESKELRNRIRTAINKYRRFKSNLTLRFVNPDAEPDTVRELGIRVDGEMIVHYNGRSENLREISELAISNALFRLSNPEQRWIVFTSGHGERSPTGSANHDIGQFGKQLQTKGYRILELKSNLGANIPDNASLLVIADPSVDLLAGEIDAILEYLGNGGNLLWLQDSKRLKGLEALNKMLDIRVLPGVIVDANSRSYGLNNPAFVTLSEYPDHPITAHIRSISLFPRSGAVEVVSNGAFHATPILLSSSQSWSEQGPIKGHLQFNPEQGEKRGPLNLSVALTRGNDKAEQRIVVLGDGDFLSNTYLGNGVNLDLGISMVQWLTEDDNSIDIPIRFRPDQSLDIAPTEVAALGVIFVILIPVLLVASGLLIHRKRKRA